MKKTLRIFSLFMVLVLALSAMTACEIPENVLEMLPDEIIVMIPGLNPENPPADHEHSFVDGKCECGESDPTYVPSTDSGKVKVYWLQGQKELRVDEVEKGTVLTSWEPKVSGKEFKGWFSDPGCTKAFDFTQPIQKETEIYASFKTVAGGDDPIEPEYADYYLIGTGMGSLAVSSWDHNNSATQLGMEDKGNGTYTITIDFYAGDMFQICHGLSWDGQMGLGYIPGAALVEGSETQGEVKDAEGNVVFTGVQEYSNPMTAWNITCALGQDGKYTFTLDPINGTITWELIERYEAKDVPAVENAIYFIGTFNNWDTLLGLTDEWKLTKSEDGKTWTGKLTVTEDMYADWTLAEMGFSCVALKLYDKGASKWIGYNGDNNLGLVAGVYEFTYDVASGTFTYNLEGEAPVIPEAPDSELIFVGTMNEWDTTNATGEWALTQGEDGKTWTGTLVVTEDMYADWTATELGQLCAAVKLFDKGTNKWIAYESDKNLALTVGTYHFKYVVGDANFTYWADGAEEPTTPEVPETPAPEVPTEGTVLYFNPGTGWTSDGARFALYTWNDAGNLWVDFVDSDADGIYECELPAGYTNVIFCRMNPASAENVWENKWNQTSDLLLSGNYFTVNEGEWDGANGTWSTK